MTHIIVNQHRLLDVSGMAGKRAGFCPKYCTPAAFQTAYGLVAQLDTGVVCFVVEEVFYCVACFFFVVVVVVAVQMYAQGFKTGERLLPIRRGVRSVCCAGPSTVCRCGHGRVHHCRRGSRSLKPGLS